MPAGDALGVSASNDPGTLEVYGYLVPQADVPASPVRHRTRTQVTIRR